MSTVQNKRQSIDYNMVVADNIRAELSRERWSHRQAAIALGVTPNWVNRRMSGETRLDADDIALFAAFLDVSIADLFVPKKKGPASEDAGPNSLVHPLGLEPRTHWLWDNLVDSWSADDIDDDAPVEPPVPIERAFELRQRRDELVSA